MNDLVNDFEYKDKMISKHKEILKLFKEDIIKMIINSEEIETDKKFSYIEFISDSIKDNSPVV
jgi:hypothetical protein